jgi:hypothetical protein
MLPNAYVKAASPAVKISSGHTTTNGNGNGSDAVSGRGLAHRKWTLAERVAHAADVATGVKHLDLSHGQLCSVFHITAAALRAEIKARAGNGKEDKEEETEETAAVKEQLLAIVIEYGFGLTTDMLSKLEAESLE